MVRILNEEWSSQLWSQFLQLRKEAWKKFRTSVRSSNMIYFICIIHLHIFHGNIWTQNWPAPNVSGFIAQLVERRTGIVRSRVQAPLKSWIFFRLLYAIAKIAIITARIILHLISYPQFTYDLFHMHHSRFEYCCFIMSGSREKERKMILRLLVLWNFLSLPKETRYVLRNQVTLLKEARWPPLQNLCKSTRARVRPLLHHLLIITLHVRAVEQSRPQW